MNETNQNSFTDNNYYNLPLYKGKEQFNGDVRIHKEIPRIVITIPLGIFSIILAITVEELSTLGIVFFILFLVVTIINQAEMAYKIRIKTDSTGITKEYDNIDMHLAWDEIEYIKVIPEYNNTKAKVIYIKNIISDNDDSRKTYKIVMPYLPKAVHCIMKYWNKEIQNLDSMNSWQKYINRL